jgi:hypothetical protein
MCDQALNRGMRVLVSMEKDTGRGPYISLLHRKRHDFYVRLLALGMVVYLRCLQQGAITKRIEGPNQSSFGAS